MNRSGAAFYDSMIEAGATPRSARAAGERMATKEDVAKVENRVVRLEDQVARIKDRVAGLESRMLKLEFRVGMIVLSLFGIPIFAMLIVLIFLYAS